MSQMLKIPAILDGLKQDCIDAFGFTEKTVYYGDLQIPSEKTKYAILKLLPVEMGALAARTVFQNILVEIRIRMPFPSEGNILLYKIEQANLLIGQIITGPNYLNLAHLPYITGFDPTEEDDPQNRWLEFTITFSCQVEEDHH
jgi:hypothetical protein